jgi:hypothetical protein
MLGHAQRCQLLDSLGSIPHIGIIVVNLTSQAQGLEGLQSRGHHSLVIDEDLAVTIHDRHSGQRLLARRSHPGSEKKADKQLERRT